MPKEGDRMEEKLMKLFTELSEQDKDKVIDYCKRKVKGYVICEYCGTEFVKGEPFCTYCGKSAD